MADRWRRLPKWAKWAIGIFALISVIAAIPGGGGEDSADEKADTTPRPAQTQTTAADEKSEEQTEQEKDAPSVDENTKNFLRQLGGCQRAVSLTRTIIAEGGEANLVELADSTTKARDICETIRTELATGETDHFDEEAAIGFYAADRYKSGLNAILAYIDNPRPTKIIEARNKLNEGDGAAREARREINRRRQVYGLNVLK